MMLNQGYSCSGGAAAPWELQHAVLISDLRSSPLWRAAAPRVLQLLLNTSKMWNHRDCGQRTATSKPSTTQHPSLNKRKDSHLDRHAERTCTKEHLAQTLQTPPPFLPSTLLVILHTIIDPTVTILPKQHRLSIRRDRLIPLRGPGAFGINHIISRLFGRPGVLILAVVPMASLFQRL